MTTETEGAADAGAEIESVAEQDAVSPEAQAEGAETETAEEGEGGEGQPKPKKTAKERIDELTAARHAADRRAEEKARDADYWRDQAMRTQQQQPTPTAQAQPTEDKEPDPADYTHGDLDAAFIRDHATFHARKTFREEADQRDRQRAAEQAQTAWQAKEDAAKTKFADYDEKVTEGAKRNAWACTRDMLLAIQESDVGPDLAYELASNPAEARRIAALSPHSQIRELGRLEAKLTAPQQPKAKTATDAPEPPQSLRGNGGKFQAAPDTSDFAAFERTYGGG